MRIAHYVCSHVSDPEITRYVLRLAAAQERAGHAVTLFDQAPGISPVGRAVEIVHGWADLQQRVRHRGCHVLHVHGLVPPATSLGEVALIRSIHDHVAYCPSTSRYQTWWQAPCERAFHPLGCAAGYLTSGCGGGMPLHRWLRALTQAGTRLATLRREIGSLVVSSDYIKAQLTASGVPAAQVPVALIPAPTRPAMTALPPDHARVLFDGALEAREGIHVLLEAVRGLTGEVSLDLLGEGTEAPSVQRAIERSGLQRRVRLLGTVDAAARTRAYEEAWVVVAPCLWPRPAPASVLEALARGRAVLASRVGCLPEYVEDGVTGLLVPPGSSQMLAAALERLLLDSARAQGMGAEARARAETQLAMDRHLQRVEALYLDAVGACQAS